MGEFTPPASQQAAEKLSHEGKEAYGKAQQIEREIFEPLSQADKITFIEVLEESFSQGNLEGGTRFIMQKRWETVGRPFTVIVEKGTPQGKIERETFTVAEDDVSYTRELRQTPWRRNERDGEFEIQETLGFSRLDDFFTLKERDKNKTLLDRLAQARNQIVQSLPKPEAVAA